MFLQIKLNRLCGRSYLETPDSKISAVIYKSDLVHVKLREPNESTGTLQRNFGGKSPSAVSISVSRSRDPRGAQNPSGLHRDIEGRIDKSLSEITVEFKFYLVSSKRKDK